MSHTCLYIIKSAEGLGVVNKKPFKALTSEKETRQTLALKYKHVTFKVS